MKLTGTFVSAMRQSGVSLRWILISSSCCRDRTKNLRNVFTYFWRRQSGWKTSRWDTTLPLSLHKEPCDWQEIISSHSNWIEMCVSKIVGLLHRRKLGNHQFKFKTKALWFCKKKIKWICGTASSGISNKLQYLL